MSIVAPRMLVRLRNSRLLHCSCYGDGGALFAGSLLQLTESVALYVEQSHFVQCESYRGLGGAAFIKSVTLANVTIKTATLCQTRLGVLAERYILLFQSRPQI